MRWGGETEHVPRRALRLFVAVAGGYVLGTIPSAQAAARLASGGTVDLRRDGSGNPGGLNARRLLGHRVGAAAIGADIAKGVAAGAFGRRLAGDLGAHAACVAGVGGHCYPVWSRFRGGKGVATSFGQCLYTFPAYAPVDLAVATAASRLPGIGRPALVAGGIASTAWVLAGVVWWRGRLPNLWGPRPTTALPLANAATALLLATRAIQSLRRHAPDELALDR